MRDRILDLVGIVLIANGVAFMHVTGDLTGLLPLLIGSSLYGNFREKKS